MNKKLEIIHSAELDNKEIGKEKLSIIIDNKHRNGKLEGARCDSPITGLERPFNLLEVEAAWVYKSEAANTLTHESSRSHTTTQHSW